MTDQPGRGTDTPVVPTTTHNPFSGLWDKASHVVHDLPATVQSGFQTTVRAADHVYHDPKVQSGVQEAGAAAQRIGRGAAAQAQGEVQQTAAAAQRGDMRAVAGHIIGGPHVIVGKIVATQVVNEGMRHLSPQAQRAIESSAVGRTVVSAAERGHIPLSPTDVVRTVVGSTRDNLVTGGRESIVNALPTGRAQNLPIERTQPAAAAPVVRTAATDNATAAPSFLNMHQPPSWLPQPQTPIMSKH